MYIRRNQPNDKTRIKTMTSSTVCISDVTGKKYFNTLCSAKYASSEIRNMGRHLEQAKKHPLQFRFLDIPTAHILLDGKPISPIAFNMTDDELLTALGV